MGKKASCAMEEGCMEPLAYIGEKGYVYCAKHGVQRKCSGWERCRKMCPWEVRWILAGKALPSYRPGPEPKA